MNHIRIVQAFQNNGKEFRFPEDLHLFLDKKRALLNRYKFDKMVPIVPIMVL